MTEEARRAAAPFFSLRKFVASLSDHRSASCSNSGYAVPTLAACAADRCDGPHSLVTVVTERASIRGQSYKRKRHQNMDSHPGIRIRLGAGNQSACCHRGHSGGIRAEKWQGLAQSEGDLLRLMDRWPSLLVHGRKTHRRPGSVGRARILPPKNASDLMFAFIALPSSIMLAVAFPLGSIGAPVTAAWGPVWIALTGIALIFRVAQAIKYRRRRAS